ncbi:uncharacterized protein A4U43_C06F14480 [Asparagus officinalis]|uniref:Uncharacterized protein n=1 Tax=Asparagus officinalis TaxID=4686 RepID=A0A5P1EM57_ASPOF|nr:uncharacterized protein A4U43_C06F14480 [Asparagus officinalis]
MMASSSSSSEFTADELEAAEAPIKLKTTDPDSTLSDFFPRWLQKKKRLLPYDEKSNERGKRLSPDTPLDVPRSLIAGDKNPFFRLPPLLSCSKMDSLKKNGDEKQGELVNKKKEQKMNAVSATQRNFQECVMEPVNRYPILEDDNSSLRQIPSPFSFLCYGILHLLKVETF